MADKVSPVVAESIEIRILTLRGQKVMLDADLAGLYRVETKALNQAVKRNSERFTGLDGWDYLKAGGDSK